MRPYGRQILICEHGDCASPEAAQRLAGHFRVLARVHGLTTLRNPQRFGNTGVPTPDDRAAFQAAVAAGRSVWGIVHGSLPSVSPACI